MLYDSTTHDLNIQYLDKNGIGWLSLFLKDLPVSISGVPRVSRARVQSQFGRPHPKSVWAPPTQHACGSIK